jgi:predicted dehydrogenase
MDPAFSYDSLQTEMSSPRGKTENQSYLKLSPKNQFALEMNHFGECVEEGLHDHHLMEAIYESAKTGKLVQLMAGAPSELDRFRGSPPQS